MNIQYFRKKLRIIAGCCLLLSALTLYGEKPNFLIIIADDCTFSDLSLYGGKNALTPNIDRLSTEGMTFNRASITVAMCQPARSELYTGQYPMRNGATWNHCKSYPETQSMPQYLGALGYRVGIAGKKHIEPDEAFPFEDVDGYDPRCVRNPTRPHNVRGIQEFMNRSDQPFALVVALVEPHKPWVMGDPSQYPTDSIQLPEYLVDTPETRSDFANYLAEITYMDEQMGEILEVLENSGKSKDTLVLFTSEQGAQWPGCKWTNWECGIHTALIARFPGRIPSGVRTDELVQYADVLPTFLDIVGADPDDYPLDGMSFRDVLFESGKSQRTFYYGMHNNIPAGHAYPSRSVSDGHFKYIRNLRPDYLFINKAIMGRKSGAGEADSYWPSWMWKSANDEHAFEMIRRYMIRPPEELYDLQNDPLELNNLAGQSAYHEIQSMLGSELDRWMKSQNDPGAPLDTQEAFQRSKDLDHLYHY